MIINTRDGWWCTTLSPTMGSYNLTLNRATILCSYPAIDQWMACGYLQYAWHYGPNNHSSQNIFFGACKCYKCKSELILSEISVENPPNSCKENPPKIYVKKIPEDSGLTLSHYSVTSTIHAQDKSTKWLLVLLFSQTQTETGSVIKVLVLPPVTLFSC